MDVIASVKETGLKGDIEFVRLRWTPAAVLEVAKQYEAYICGDKSTKDYVIRSKAVELALQSVPLLPPPEVKDAVPDNQP